MTPLTALYADKRDKVDSISGGMIADVAAGERLSRPFGRVLVSPSDIVHTLLSRCQTWTEDALIY